MVASDGVWEFLPNEEVAKIAEPFYSKSAPEAAANALVKEAYKKWKIVIEAINMFRKKRSSMTSRAS